MTLDPPLNPAPVAQIRANRAALTHAATPIATPHPNHRAVRLRVARLLPARAGDTVVRNDPRSGNNVDNRLRNLFTATRSQ